MLRFSVRSQDFQPRKSQKRKFVNFLCYLFSFSLSWHLLSCLSRSWISEEECSGWGWVFLFVLVSLLPILMKMSGFTESVSTGVTAFVLILKNKYQRKKSTFETNHVASQHNVTSKLKLYIKGRGALSTFQGEFFLYVFSLWCCCISALRGSFHAF